MCPISSLLLLIIEGPDVKLDALGRDPAPIGGTCALIRGAHVFTSAALEYVACGALPSLLPLHVRNEKLGQRRMPALNCRGRQARCLQKHSNPAPDPPHSLFGGGGGGGNERLGPALGMLGVMVPNWGCYSVEMYRWIRQMFRLCLLLVRHLCKKPGWKRRRCMLKKVRAGVSLHFQHGAGKCRVGGHADPTLPVSCGRRSMTAYSWGLGLRR